VAAVFVRGWDGFVTAWGRPEGRPLQDVSVVSWGTALQGVPMGPKASFVGDALQGVPMGPKGRPLRASLV